jgi:hypothetical protein
MRTQDGRKNRNKPVQACRKSFAKDERGLTAMEGVALYIQNPAAIEGHYLDLPGSVRTDCYRLSAGLGDLGDGPKLYWDWDDGVRSDYNYGSASRGE